MSSALWVPLLAQGEQNKKPNIVVIWGDDIGWSNISAYNMGMMGIKTPNIDRIAKEGAKFTGLYAQRSCTAGRASFVHSVFDYLETTAKASTAPFIISARKRS